MTLFSIVLESNLNLGVGGPVGVGRPFCSLSHVSGKKPALEAALLFSLLSGDESAGGSHWCPEKEENTADQRG